MMRRGARLLVCALLALPVAAIGAGSEPSVSDAQLARARVLLDQRLARVKAQVLPPYAEHERLRVDAPLLPLSVYIGVDFEGLVLEAAEVQLDGAEIVSHTYRREEAMALLDGGWQRLVHEGLAPGEYRLQARLTGELHTERRAGSEHRLPTVLTFEFTFQHGGKTGASASAGASSGSSFLLPVETRCEVTSSRERGLSVPISLVRYKPLAGHPLRLKAVGREAPAGSSRASPSGTDEKKDRCRQPATATPAGRHGEALYVPGSEGDPRLRAARMHLQSGDLLKADALAHASRHEGARRTDPAYSALRADLFVALGMVGAAEAAYARLPADDPRYLTGQLLLAETEYQRGYHSAAAGRLHGLELADDALRGQRDELLSRIWLASGEPERVVDWIAGEAPRDELTSFHLAQAYLATDRGDAAEKLLWRIGDPRRSPLQPDGPGTPMKARRALRDRANLVLGQHLLDRKAFAEAREAFARIHVDGPYGSAALLATGWAWLADRSPGAPQPLGAEARSPLAALAALLPGVGADADRPLLKREPAQYALLYWRRLAQGDPVDPMVQEARLAAAWLMHQGGDPSAALAAYQEAIAGLESARAHVDEALASFDHRRFIDRMASTGEAERFARAWRVRGLPDVPATYWTTDILAHHAFQETLRNYRDTEKLAEMLDTLESAAALDVQHIRVLRAETQQLRDLLGRLMRQLLVTRIDARRDQIERHLVRAHFSVARIHEGQ